MVQMMLKRYPDDAYLHLGLFRDYVQIGMHKEAIQEPEKVLASLAFRNPRRASIVPSRVSGYRGAMRQFARELEDLVATKQVFIPFNLAQVYATLGDKDRAFYWLEQAYSHRDILAPAPTSPWTGSTWNPCLILSAPTRDSRIWSAVWGCRSETAVETSFKLLCLESEYVRNSLLLAPAGRRIDFDPIALTSTGKLARASRSPCSRQR